MIQGRKFMSWNRRSAGAERPSLVDLALRRRSVALSPVEIALSGRNGTQPNNPEQLVAEICCSYCGQRGSVVWEDHHFEGHKRRLVNLTAGFHAEDGRTQSGVSLIVCDICDNFEIG